MAKNAQKARPARTVAGDRWRSNSRSRHDRIMRGSEYLELFTKDEDLDKEYGLKTAAVKAASGVAK